MKFWVIYTNNTVSTFEFDSEIEAYCHFMMEGDHAYDFGRYEKEEEIPPVVLMPR